MKNVIAKPIVTEPITIKGAREHNLKNIDVIIPRHELTVVTGVSGSGKSSLVIDTLFAEGQRRYVESLSVYARQFLMRMDKPDVDLIEGISPAIAINQKVSSKNTRSTVGSLTEIYDYLRLLYARVGKTYSPISGEMVKKDSVTDVVNFVLKFTEGSRLLILSPLFLAEKTILETLTLAEQNGYSRIISKKFGIINIEEALEKSEKELAEVLLVVDRIITKDNDEELKHRIADSVETTFFESHGECIIQEVEGKARRFNNKFELDGMLFEEPSPNLFSFNNPHGACPKCEGFGTIIGIDEDLVIPNKSLSIYDGAIACWKGEKMKAWKEDFIKHADKFDFPIHRPFAQLTKEQRKLLWTGNQFFEGIEAFFKMVESNTYKIQYRVMLARYRGRTTCTNCWGSRLRKETEYIKIDGKAISDLLQLPVKKLYAFTTSLKLNKQDKAIADRILVEINNRLEFMIKVGLKYLTLLRSANTLSGGETQRIQLTRSLGSNLTDSLYILDEPSVGLHPRDTSKLVDVLRALRDLGNTVVVVEHEEEMIKSADHLIDIGPHAGIFGGEVVFEGSPDALKNGDSLTANYLSGTMEIPIPKQRRKTANFLELKGVGSHNLKHFDVKFPLNGLTVVSGVSGSGKTTLVKQILYPALQQALYQNGNKPGVFSSLEGDVQRIHFVDYIDQNPLGRSSRSNPVTYIKAYDAIRDLFARQQMSKIHGYKPKHFSFNVEGGRCETCAGEGFQTIEMQFLADVRLLCEECNGKRFKDDVLEVKVKDKNISDVLNLSVDEALEFFADIKEIHERMKPLHDVGLGYVKLGQSSSTLSGGEAQRVKLASYLARGSNAAPILFIFDEPTTGLHFDDINKLLTAFNALIDNGHSIIVIEHNMDVIKCADWLIDLGPEGGDEGGYLLYQGVPEGLLKEKKSYTGKYLKEKLT